MENGHAKCYATLCCGLLSTEKFYRRYLPSALLQMQGCAGMAIASSFGIAYAAIHHPHGRNVEISERLHCCASDRQYIGLWIGSPLDKVLRSYQRHFCLPVRSWSGLLEIRGSGWIPAVQSLDDRGWGLRQYLSMRSTVLTLVT